MIPPAVLAAFADALPEGGANVRAARSEDRERIRRMLESDSEGWSSEDIDIVMARAQTTLGGPETFKWVLPVWVFRSMAEPAYGWMTVSEVLADKLDRAGFDLWPEAQRVTILPMLADWLRARETAFAEDEHAYDPADDAVFRSWLDARCSVASAVT
ncbi:MAG: hypothetical protein REJ23_06460 [Brevundimonas sp.]|nr:hypothetical protein [Brevundimonas sp.]